VAHDQRNAIAQQRFNRFNENQSGAQQTYQQQVMFPQSNKRSEEMARIRRNEQENQSKLDQDA
jgi:hypothetical protein